MSDFIPLVRIHQTPGDVLGAMFTHAVVGGGISERLAYDRMSQVARFDSGDLKAIIRRDIMPAGEMLDALAGSAGPMGLSPSALAYRASMERAIGDAEEGAVKRYEFTMSTATPDHADDIVEQDWDLSVFAANPVAPWSHNSSAPPVGSWQDVGVRGEMLGGFLVPLALPSYPLSETVAAQLDAGILRTVSVGFRPGEAFARASMDPTDSRYDDGWGYVYRGNVLLECSPCTIPMNPEARIRVSPPPAARHWLTG